MIKRQTEGNRNAARAAHIRVFAALGSTLRVGDAPLLDERGYAALVAVVVLTTLVTPPALKWSLGRKVGTSGDARSVA